MQDRRWASEGLPPPPIPMGRTPVAQLIVEIGELKHTILLKEERWNPFGSVKDRVAWGLLWDAFNKGELKAGDHIVDASSGNYGCALACLGKQLGLGVTIASSSNISTFNVEAIRRAGAALIIAEPFAGESMHEARLRTAREIAIKKGAFFLDQYHNAANYETHRVWTAPETLSNPGIQACFVCASSGGTARGFANYIYFNSSEVQLVLVDALRSRVFFEPPALDGVSLTIPGFGSSKPSEFAPLPVVAGLMRVADAQVIAAFELVLQLNICSSGLSSAGLLVGTLNWLAKQGEPKKVICLCADGAEKYVSDLTAAGNLESKYPGLHQHKRSLERILSSASVANTVSGALAPLLMRPDAV